MVQKNAVDKKGDKFVRLWIHESMRCFYDRLIDDQDRNWFQTEILQYLKTFFHLDWKPEQLFGEEPYLWGNFFKGADAKIYDEMNNMEALKKILQQYLVDYNEETSNPMNLVFFNDAILHLLRICRILSQPKGNAMLVGLGGSGRQSLTRLAAYICEMSCCTIEIKRGYDYRVLNLLKHWCKSSLLSKCLIFMCIVKHPQVHSRVNFSYLIFAIRNF